MFMRLLSLVLLLLSNFIIIHAQLPQKPNATDADGLKQGEWIFLYDITEEEAVDTSEIAFYRIVNYKDGKPVGNAEDYYITGEKRAEMIMISDNPMILDGSHKIFYKDGQLKSLVEYDMGKPKDEKKFFYPDGSVDSSAYYYDSAKKMFAKENLFGAIDNYKKSLVLKKSKIGTENIDYCTVLKDLGYALVIAREFAEGEKAILEYKEIFERLYGKKSMAYSTALYLLSGVYQRTNQMNKAAEVCKEDMQISKEKYGENSNNYIQGSIQLGAIYQGMAKFEEALQVLNDTKTKLEAVGDTTSKNYDDVIFYLGIVYRSLGRFDEALSCFEINKANSLKKNGEESTEYITILGSISIVHLQMAQWEKALESNSYRLKILKKIYGEDHIALAGPYYALGMAYSRMGIYTKAVESLEKSLELYKKKFGGLPPQSCNVVSELATNMRFLGRFDEAEEIGKLSLNLSKAHYGESHPSFSIQQKNLSHVYIEMGRYEAAIELLEQALEICKNAFGEDHFEVANCYSKLAMTNGYILNFKEAIELEQKAISIFEKIYGIDHINYISSMNSLGNFYRSVGEYGKSDSIFKSIMQSVEKHQKSNGRIYAAIIAGAAFTKLELEDFDTAKELFLESYRVLDSTFGKEHPSQIKGLVNIAGLHFRLEEDEEAEQYFRECFTRVFNSIERFFPALSENEKIKYWNTLSMHLVLFNNYVTKYYEEKPEILEDMYNYSLFSKGMILEAKKKSLQRARNMSKILTNWQSTREYWMKLMQNPELAEKMGVDIDSVEQAANQYEKMMSESSSRLKATFDTTKVRWYDVQKALKEGEAAVEIIRFKTHDRAKYTGGITYAALILKGGNDKNIELVLLNNGKELENEKLKEYIEIINKNKRVAELSSSEKKKLEELYEQFWEKISEKVRGAKSIYISPDGVFHKINIQTLINPETGKYLLEELDVIMLTSTKDLCNAYEISSSSVLLNNDSTAVLFGDPEFNLNESDDAGKESKTIIASSMDRTLNNIKRMGNINKLPGTKKEIIEIEKKLSESNWQTRVYSGDKALESEVKALSGPKILHIATHGVFLEDLEISEKDKSNYSENPMLRSMLLFAGAGNSVARAKSDSTNERSMQEDKIWDEDGILTAYEVISLDLDGTELVVLSACNTAKGEVRNGEGVFGLQRAFQVAGAKTIIMSLWSVDDNATQQLMTLFYQNLLSGDTKKQALKEAQSDIMKKFKSPFFWGAFVMVGV